MAHFVQAITRYGPRIVTTDAVGRDALAELIAASRSVDLATTMTVLEALDYALLAQYRVGTPVTLPGIGRFTPSIKVSGRIRVTYRNDRLLRDALNEAGGYVGRVRNPESIGLSPDDFKRIWDADHPDDELKLSPC